MVNGKLSIDNGVARHCLRQKDLPGALVPHKPSGSTIAYVCRGMTCSPSVTSLGDLAAEISEA